MQFSLIIAKNYSFPHDYILNCASFRYAGAFTIDKSIYPIDCVTLSTFSLLRRKITLFNLPEMRSKVPGGKLHVSEKVTVFPSLKFLSMHVYLMKIIIDWEEENCSMIWSSSGGYVSGGVIWVVVKCQKVTCGAKCRQRCVVHWTVSISVPEED